MDKFTGWSENTVATIASQCARERIAEEGARIAENADSYRGICREFPTDVQQRQACVGRQYGSIGQ